MTNKGHAIPVLPNNSVALCLLPGGGWQDQVGGLVGGVKIARSRACLPLKVEVQRLDLSEDFLLSLQQRLLLVYTGKTRLARNLLQVGPGIAFIYCNTLNTSC